MNSSRYNQNERASQSGDNDSDRIAPTDEKAAEKTKEAYFDDKQEGKANNDEKSLREEEEGSHKNSK